jgi:preprotein translocase subunit SecD
MAHRRGIRIAATTSAAAIALTAVAGCSRPVAGTPVAEPQPIQLRLVTSAEPLGSRTCPNESPAPSAVAELCERTGPMFYRLGPSMTRSVVKSAAAGESSGRWLVTFQLDDADSREVASVTAANVGKQLAIVVGARVLSAPAINMPIDGGGVQVTGGFSEAQARDLAQQLKPS